MARKPAARRRRFLLIGVISLGALALLGWVGTSFARPFMLARNMAEKNEVDEKRSMELQIEQQNLRKKNAVLQTDAGMEREARELGYVKSGEVPLIITDPSRAAK